MITQKIKQMMREVDTHISKKERLKTTQNYLIINGDYYEKYKN